VHWHAVRDDCNGNGQRRQVVHMRLCRSRVLKMTENLLFKTKLHIAVISWPVFWDLTLLVVTVLVVWVNFFLGMR
jgi:hypothetical protein